MGWENIGLGILAAVVMLLFFPGAKRMLQNSRKASAKEWMGITLPLVAVVLFVIILVSSVR